MQLDIKGCVNQWYDGASVMSGEWGVVSAKYLKGIPRQCTYIVVLIASIWH